MIAGAGMNTANAQATSGIVEQKSIAPGAKQVAPHVARTDELRAIFAQHGARDTLQLMAERNPNAKPIDQKQLQTVIEQSNMDSAGQINAKKTLDTAMGILNGKDMLASDDTIQRGILRWLAQEPTDSPLKPLVDRMAEMSHIDLTTFKNPETKSDIPFELSQFLMESLVSSDAKIALSALLEMRFKAGAQITNVEVDSIFADSLRTIWLTRLNAQEKQSIQ